AAAEEAIPALSRALQDPDLQVRVQAAQALWEVDHPAEKVVPALLEGLKDKNAILRRLSATVLAQIEPIPPLTLPSPPSAGGEGRVRGGAVPALQAALKDEEMTVRVNAAMALCGAPGHVKEAVPMLVTALQDDTRDYAFAGRVGIAVEQIAGPEAVEGLLRAFTASPRRFRPLIAQALGQTGPAGLTPLIQLVGDEDSAVRVAAVRVLGQKERNAAAAVPALVKALRD